MRLTLPSPSLLIIGLLLGSGCAGPATDEAPAAEHGPWVEALGPAAAPPHGQVRVGGIPSYTGLDSTSVEVLVAGAAGGVRILGTTVDEGDALRFEPRFPFEAGLSYHLRVRAGDALLSETLWELPAPERHPTTLALGVAPGHAQVPANLLKFYVAFSAPMRRGEAYRHLTLALADGRPAEGVFLQLDPELWDPETRRLTLLLDPGRIKRGLRLREELGPTLIEGEDYVLRIDPTWRDARGVPLAAGLEHRFHVGPPDRTSPDPASWQLTVPPEGTHQPLVVRFDEPLDRALLEGVVYVRESLTWTRVAGRVTLSDDELQWSLAPERPWAKGDHDLVADGVLEDRSGNNPGRTFETPAGSTVEAGPVVATVLTFRVR